MKGVLTAVFRTPQAQAAISITRDGIAVVGFTGLASQPSLSVQEMKPLEIGTVVPGVMSSNITDPKAVASAIKQLITKYKNPPKRIAMVLPDAVARVTLLTFDTVPEREKDLTQLIKLKMQRSAPFNLDDAQLSYRECGRNSEKQVRFLAVVVQNSVLGEYEDVCSTIGLKVGCVDLASFNLINAALYTSSKKQQGDWMVVHTASDYNTVAILRNTQLIFYRTQIAEPNQALGDFIYQTTMYYEDRLGGNGINQVVFAATGAENSSRNLEQIFEEIFNGASNVIFEQLGKRIAGSIKNTENLPLSTLDSLAAPIGILVRDRHV